MNVAVVGLGDLGCVSAARLLRSGHRVFAVDSNEAKVSMVNAGQFPMAAPGLDELLAGFVSEGRLTATCGMDEAVRHSHVALICVDPPAAEPGQIDIDTIERIGRQISEAIPAGNEPYTVVVRSAVPPGTTERVLLPVLKAGLDGRPGARVRVAMNPELRRQGASSAALGDPAVIVVGTDDPGAAALVRSMYSGVKAPFVHTTLSTAELVKYACNTYDALEVRFRNEMTDLAAGLRADGDEVLRIFALARRSNRPGATKDRFTAAPAPSESHTAPGQQSRGSRASA